MPHIIVADPDKQEIELLILLFSSPINLRFVRATTTIPDAKFTTLDP
jgi:hypothetical protein